MHTNRLTIQEYHVVVLRVQLITTKETCIFHAQIDAYPEKRPLRAIRGHMSSQSEILNKSTRLTFRGI
jgi:hypothetical protein